MRRRAISLLRSGDAITAILSPLKYLKISKSRHNRDTCTELIQYTRYDYPSSARIINQSHQSPMPGAIQVPIAHIQADREPQDFLRRLALPLQYHRLMEAHRQALVHSRLLLCLKNIRFHREPLPLPEHTFCSPCKPQEVPEQV